MKSRLKGLGKNFFLFAAIFLIIAGFLSSRTIPLKSTEKVSINQLMGFIKEGKVTAVEIDQNTIRASAQDGSTVKKIETRKEGIESFSDLLKTYDIPGDKIASLSITIKEASGLGFWLGTILPFLIPFLFIAAFIYIMTRQVQGANNRAMMFGQSGARQEDWRVADKNKRITFKDVAGAEEAKEELQEIVEFLKTPQKFLNLGARIPRGVLLMGPPGTGKTLMARAVAGEANVPFFHISGSEFVEMFVGVGASRVRDLFRRAKKNAPAIVFIDEIDAVGRQRGAGLGGSHDEREQTLNQILVEMDGFESNVNIIIIAATNRPDVLDPALLRPGRFDRQVVLDKPDVKEREAILKVHSKEKPLAADVSLKTVAQRTPGFSGADLANLINEAAIFSARRGLKEVGATEMLESIEKVLLGPERKSHILSDAEKKITAYHEAGHAVVAHSLPHSSPVHKVSIISRGRAAGYTLKIPNEDKHLHSKKEFLDELAVLLAGHAIESETFGDVTTGASNDLREATRLARRLVTEFGMSEKLGPQTFGEHEELIFLGREITEQRNYSEKVAQVIDEEVSSFLKGAYTKAKEVIVDQKVKIEALVAVLIEKETIEREDFASLMS